LVTPEKSTIDPSLKKFPPTPVCHTNNDVRAPVMGLIMPNTLLLFDVALVEG